MNRYCIWCGTPQSQGCECDDDALYAAWLDRHQMYAAMHEARRLSLPIRPSREQRAEHLAAIVSTAPTRLLLHWLRRARACHPHASENDPNYGYDPGRGFGEIPIATLKAELALREHIPNKAERRIARQQAAKNRRGRGRGR